MPVHVKLTYAAGASLAAVLGKPATPEYYDPVADAWVAPAALADALTALAAEGASDPAAQVYSGEIATPAASVPDGEYHVFVVDAGDASLPIVGASVATVIDGSDAWVEPTGAVDLSPIQGEGYDPAEHSLSALAGALAQIQSDLSALAGSGSTPLPAEAVLSDSFASDADLAAAVAPEDWSRLTPDNQVVARGTDGIIPAGGYTLTSATNPDFEARGVQAGMVARIHDAEAMTTDLFCVAGVSGGTLTLRRIALGAGEGEPPGGASGKSGVTFDVQTFARQLRIASGWLADLTGETPGDTEYAERLRRATVARVAYDAYSKVGDEVPNGTYGGGKWQRAARKFLSDLIQEIVLIQGLQAEATIAVGGSVAGGPKPIAVGRFEDPCDWIVPRPW